MNVLVEKPRWYSALTDNCTTIWHRAKAVGSDFPLDWRLLANGYLVDLSVELGTVNGGIALDGLKRRSDITAPARATGYGEVFSKVIREDLPARQPVVLSGTARSASILGYLLHNVVVGERASRQSKCRRSTSICSG